MSASKKASSRREPPIRDLENRISTKSGTAGSASVAEGRDAAMVLAEEIEELPKGKEKNNVIIAFNTMALHYDSVIKHYIAKRNALREADDVIEGLRGHVDALSSMATEDRAKMNALIATRRGCGCKKQGGQCTGGCGCSGTKGVVVPCGSHCSCDPSRCQNRTIRSSLSASSSGAAASAAAASAAPPAKQKKKVQIEDIVAARRAFHRMRVAQSNDDASSSSSSSSSYDDSDDDDSDADDGERHAAPKSAGESSDDDDGAARKAAKKKSSKK
jgi:hypothetical protein